MAGVDKNFYFEVLLRHERIMADFVLQFLPGIARLADLSSITYPWKEHYSWQGGYRFGDFLVQTRFRDGSGEFLIHFEHLAMPHPDSGRRLMEYAVLDWRLYRLPVHAVAVVSHRERPNLEAPLRIDLADRRICDFNFEVIDLARMDGARYFSIGSATSLALSALMRLDDTDRIERAVCFTRALAELDLSLREQEAVTAFFFTYHPLEECEARSLRGIVSRIFAGARGSTMRTSDYLYLTVPSPSR